MRKKKNWVLGVLVAVLISISAGFQSDFFEIAKQIDIYTTLFKELNMFYIDEVNPAKLSNKAIDKMLESLDPYTRFYDEQGVEDARIAATGEYGGIGVLSRYKNNTLTIREILRNSPAEKSGLRVGDKILKIDEVVVKDFEGEEISLLFKGLPNTKVNLQLNRKNQLLNIELTRKKIDISPVPYFSMIDEEVGYISFTMFNEKAAAEVKNALIELKEEGMKKVIIDVRGNPGGLLNEAVKISNFFLPKNKIIVTTKAKIEKWSDTFKTSIDPIDLEIPVVILVNNRSASASEILAGSLQDYDRAVIMGERSFGKGLVQRYRELSYGTQMKITISKYYTPSGRCIQELDYTNRDDEGNIPKFSDAGRKRFQTEKGREVFGGGGIQPDVELKRPATTKTTEALLNSDAFFNYVTSFVDKNTSIKEPTVYKLPDSEFKGLKGFLSKNQVDFKTETELEMEKINELADADGFSNVFNKNYQEFLDKIYAEKMKELDTNKEEIMDKLTEEIVRRYYYSEGVFQQKSVFDKTIKEAVILLNNETEYNKILSN